MATIQLRNGTSALWTTNNPTLAQGEPGVESDTGLFKIGDGVTDWVNLAYPFTAVTPNPNILFLSTNSGTLTANKYIGGFVSPYNLALISGNSESFATAAVASTNAQSFNILYMASGGTALTTLGTITFAAGANTGTFDITASQNINAGDSLFIQTGSTADATLADVIITLALNNTIVAYVYPAPTTDGTLGYFVDGGNSPSTTLILNFNEFSYISGTNFTVSLGNGSAVTCAGNSVLGLFVELSTTNTYLYTYSSNIITTGTVLSLAAYGTATGTSTFAFIVNDSTTPQFYTYSTNVVTEGTVLTSSGANAAVGNSSLAVVVISTTITNIYTYSGNVVSSGTVISNNYQNQGFGNATLGVFDTNVGITTYDYSNGVITPITNSSYANLNGYGSSGNSVFGFTATSVTGITLIFEYANSTITSTLQIVGNQSTSNGIAGITL